MRFDSNNDNAWCNLMVAVKRFIMFHNEIATCCHNYTLSTIWRTRTPNALQIRNTRNVHVDASILFCCGITFINNKIEHCLWHVMFGHTKRMPSEKPELLYRITWISASLQRLKFNHWTEFSVFPKAIKFASIYCGLLLTQWRKIVKIIMIIFIGTALSWKLHCLLHWWTQWYQNNEYAFGWTGRFSIPSWNIPSNKGFISELRVKCDSFDNG